MLILEKKIFSNYKLLKKLVEKTKLPINIIGCEIHREKDGLAMSSRNLRLTESQRKSAPYIYKTLTEAKEKSSTSSFSEIDNWVEQKFHNHPELKLEYFEIAEETTLKTTSNRDSQKKYRAFIAVFAGKIRLIDNISF
jgi:pantoate--beta-alanine ligase